MKKALFPKKDLRTSERGVTAIELMIAMAIFLIVMGAVYGLLRIGNMSRSTINSRTENIKNVRMAIDTIGREAVNAGLGYNRVGGSVPDDFTYYNFGMPPDPDNDTDLLTAISTGVNISQTTVAGVTQMNDVVAFAFRDFQFNDGFPIVITDATQSNGKLILKTPDGACANCRPFDLFLIETGEGKQAVVLSTDIVNNNQIVLDGAQDALGIDFGQVGKGKGGKDILGDAQEKLADAQKELADAQQNLIEAQKKGDAKKIAEAQQKILEAQQKVTNAQQQLAAALASTGGSGSTVKKCVSGINTDCINYGSTTVTAKKIYLVSYSVSEDGTLYRTTYGNNTGATAAEQIVRQPIAQGVRSFKLQYLLSDGTVTSDPSVASTQKERCNDIVQIEVTVVVDSLTDKGGGVMSSDPITLTSTFSTRNLKYDTY